MTIPESTPSNGEFKEGEPDSQSLGFDDSTGELPVLTAYDKEVFHLRLKTTIDGAKYYDGSLLKTWEEAERIGIGSSLSAGPDAEVLDDGQNAQIDKLVDYALNANMTSVAIEAAHVYCYEDLGSPALQKCIAVQASFAAVLSEKLEDEGITAKQVLFVDDYNPDPSDGVQHDRLDIDELIKFLQTFGYSPEFLLREGSMVDLAKGIVSHMRSKKGLVVAKTEAGEEAEPDDDTSLYLAYRNHELYRAGDGMFSCAMLDAALTILKLHYIGEGVINILPRRNEDHQFSYKSQQRKTRNIIAEHLGIRIMPFVNLFTGSVRTDEIAVGAHNALRKKRQSLLR